MKSLKPNEMNKHRSRRLRKKLRVGEFQEFGVTIDLTFNQTVLEFEQALDELLAYVESQGYVFGGGGSMTCNEISGFLCKSERGTLTETQVTELKGWLQQMPWVTEFSVSGFIDAWHSDASAMDVQQF
jgi:uncharacterized protein YggL (DUF469 family)